MKQKKLSFAVIGMGRFGSLYADLLSKFGKVYILSRRRIKNSQFEQIEYQDLSKADVVIPAVPISGFAQTLRRIKPYIKKGAVIMDVCSVKTIPCCEMKKIFKDRTDVELFGTHPMFGPDSAKNGTKGLQMVLCPIRISKKHLNILIKIFKDLKLKIIITTPKEHDRQAANNLALVHFIGRGLAKARFKNQEITTKGFEKLIELNSNVNNDTWELFFDMQNYNPYSDKVRKNFVKALIEIDKEINKKKQKK